LGFSLASRDLSEVWHSVLLIQSSSLDAHASARAIRSVTHLVLV
jgi:hypothetical protein